MEEFKLENFYKESPNATFPNYMSLDKEALSNIQNKLFSLFDITSNNCLDLVNKVRNISSSVKITGQIEQTTLMGVLDKNQIKPETEIFINWYRFDDIDSMNLKDFCKYFDDIWYPGTDDIEVFDSTYNWILSIHHDETISIWSK